MARNHSSIAKRSRRLGIILGKEKCVRRRSYPPGVHGPKQAMSRGRMSAYGEQLREKQKAKAFYGILEKQFRRYFQNAAKTRGNTAEMLVKLLETRLDNTIYRLGWAKTRRQARQMVSHGFVTVNSKKVDIPSYQVSIGDEISIKESKLQKGNIKNIPESLKLNTRPQWLACDEKIFKGKVLSVPEGTDLEQGFDPTLIVEFYSR